MNARFNMMIALVMCAEGCATTYDAHWSEKPLAAASADDATRADALVAAGNALWLERDNKQKLMDAVANWEQAGALRPTLGVATRLARGHYLLSEHASLEGNTEEHERELVDGLNWSTTAVKLAAPGYAAALAGGARPADAVALVNKEAVAATYWYASCLGKWAAVKGVATQLKYSDEINAIIEHAVALDPALLYGGPLRFLGAIEAATAGLAGGSLERSKAAFEKSTALAPAFLGTKVAMADFLCVKLTTDADKDGVPDGKLMFKRLLEEVIAADPDADPELGPENRLEQEKARRLLAHIDERF